MLLASIKRGWGAASVLGYHSSLRHGELLTQMSAGPRLGSPALNLESSLVEVAEVP